MARPEELKDDELFEICRRLRCRVDRGAMAATCRTWGASLAASALVRQLPLLFFPKAEGASFSCLSCGGMLHHVAPFLPDGIIDARLIGSLPRRWWFAARGYSDGHELSNTATGEQIRLPDTMRIGRNNIVNDVIILAVSLSAIPNDQIAAGQCYGAALVKRDGGLFPDVMFWRLDQQIGLGSRTVALDWARSAADVMYDNGVFKFLTEGERLVFAVPEIAYDGLKLRADVWAPVVDVPGVEPNLREDHTEIVARYLVVSRGEVLMVRRYRVERMFTDKFRVYRLEVVQLGQSPEEDHFKWVELSDLGGRMIFVARGCSISFEVRDFDYPAAIEGVYYKGDADEFANGWYDLSSVDRSSMLGDCGRWSFPGNNEDCFQMPRQQGAALDHSAAAWLFL